MSDRRFEYCQAILSKLKNGEKHNKRTIEKLAAEFTIYNKNLVKEMTELAVVLIAREISNNSRFTNYEKYQQIVELYYQQVNLSHRTSQSTLFQQYSTPAPISCVASLYVHQNHSESGLYFEPSAGNGLLTIAIPYHQVIVNELDDVRLENLKHQPYKNVTRVDATNPFIEYYKKFDGVITNPPFGSLMNAENYDGYPIKTLDHLMALRALDTMKDDGRAAIIIGGHTEWDEHGRTQAGKNRLLFNYLYSHYNVEDVVLIDGHKLYSRQGTGFNVRLILINGRKQIIEGVAPLKNNVLSEVVGNFDALWHRVFGDESERADKTKDEKIRIAKAKAKAKLKLLQIEKLEGYIQTEVLKVNNEYLGVSDVKISSIINKYYNENIAGHSVTNADANIIIKFTSIGRKKSIYGRKNKNGKIIKIDNIIATAIQYLPRLLETAKFESHSYKLKPNHVKMKGLRFWNFRAKIIINNKLHNFIIPTLEIQSMDVLHYSIEYAQIKKSLVGLKAKSVKQRPKYKRFQTTKINKKTIKSNKKN